MKDISKNQQIEAFANENPDFKYDNREKVLSRVSHIDLIKGRRTHLIASLVAPAAYFAVKRRFAPLQFFAASFGIFSVLNYFNESRHDLITREINIRSSEQINRMMDLE